MANGKGSTYPNARLNRKARQREFIAAYTRDDCPTLTEARKRVRLSQSLYHDWLSEDKSFKNQIDAAKLEKRAMREHLAKQAVSDLVLDENRAFRPVPKLVDFRMEYFGFPTPPHHDPVVRAYEDKTNLRIIVLGPPGSGKDSISRDIVAHASMEARATRVSWIMKNEKFSKRRIAQRLEPYLTDKATYRTAPEGPGTQVPARNLIDDFGPFRWESGMRWLDGTKVEKTTWNTSEMYYIRRGAVEADPNLWATGIKGQLYGARVDLMVVSDPFDREDQKSPTMRKEKLDWFMGTVRSRLDERGRIMVLGTRLMPGDGYEDLMEAYIGDSRIVHQDGYYTKYANGTATVIYPAIQYDDTGEEVSYWPERFPIYGRIEYLDDTEVVLTPDVLESLSDEELHYITDVPGAVRVQGLNEIRETSPSLFQIMYQQDPPEEDEGEFSDALLDHCDDPTRTFGQYIPGEYLIHGVDPARTGGAAWWIWGLDLETGVFTLVDYFFGERLGVQGIKNQLIMEPLRKFLPRALVFEINRDSATLEMPEVLEEVRRTNTEIVPHTTQHYNRNVGDVAVSRMVFDMRDGRIRWPAATAADRDRLKLVKQHFKNWDRREQAKSQGLARWKSLGQDDISMAAWVGWVHGKDVFRKSTRKLRTRLRRIPEITKRRWQPRMQQQRNNEEVPGHEPTTDLVAAWFGDNS